MAGCIRVAFLSLPQSQTNRHGIPGRIVPVPTNVLTKETLAALETRLQDVEVPVVIQSKLKVWMPSCLIDHWIDVMFLKTYDGSGAGAGVSGPAVVDLTCNNLPASLDVIDLTCDDD